MGVAGPDRLQAWCGGIELYVSPRRARSRLISERLKASHLKPARAAALGAGNEGLLAVVETMRRWSTGALRRKN